MTGLKSSELKMADSSFSSQALLTMERGTPLKGKRVSKMERASLKGKRASD